MSPDCTVVCFSVEVRQIGLREDNIFCKDGVVQYLNSPIKPF